MRDGQQEWPVTNVYLVKYSNHYRLFLSDRPVHEAQGLIGTSNVMLFMMEGDAGNQISTGHYQFGRANGGQGYF